MNPRERADHPDPADSRRSWLPPAVFSATIVLLIAHALSYNFISDDAFIAARYSRNLASGQGWVYNTGERVEGYTSFIWVGAGALIGWMGFDFVDTVRALSLAGGIGCLLVMFVSAPLLGLKRNSLFACTGPLLLSCSGAFACWSLAGLEASAYAALVLTVVILVGRSEWLGWRLAIAGCVAGLCVLMRPEGILTALGLILWMTIQRGRGCWRSVLIFSIPCLMIVGAHLWWRQAYYGEWLPNTFYAKVGTGFDQYYRGLKYVAHFATDYGGLFLWILPFIVVWFLPDCQHARGLAIVGLLMVLGVIAVGGDGLPMYRFLVPIIPIWALLVQTILTKLYVGLMRAFPNGMGRLRLSIMMMILILVMIVGLANKPRRSSQYQLYKQQKTVEIPRWSAAGKWLAKHASADASIACVPIGAVGYYSGLHVYDMMGLTDKHIAHIDVQIGKGWAGHEKHDGPYILSKKPTYLLLGNIQVIERKLPLDHPRFVRPRSPAIRLREDDMFVPELLRDYKARVVPISKKRYFHFLQRSSSLE